jgi:hypothetical protein
MPDLDQGGIFRETTKVYQGPSLGWNHGMFGMQYPSAAGAAAIFGTAIPAKTSFDTYNNT